MDDMQTQLANLDAAVTRLTAQLTTLAERIDKQIALAEDFAERFEEVVTTIESERRVDRFATYD